MNDDQVMLMAIQRFDVQGCHDSGPYLSGSAWVIHKNGELESVALSAPFIGSERAWKCIAPLIPVKATIDDYYAESRAEFTAYHQWSTNLQRELAKRLGYWFEVVETNGRRHLVPSRGKRYATNPLFKNFAYNKLAERGNAQPAMIGA